MAGREVNRREAIKAGLGGVGVLGLGGRSPASTRERRSSRSRMGECVYREDGRQVPAAGDFDVVVCGAGPAGVAAALAVARLGANVQLIETNGCLGRIWTAGLLYWILDTRDKPGILQQIMSGIKHRQAGYVNQPGYSFAYDAEIMKLLLEQMAGRLRRVLSTTAPSPTLVISTGAQPRCQYSLLRNLMSSSGM